MVSGHFHVSEKTPKNDSPGTRFRTQNHLKSTPERPKTAPGPIPEIPSAAAGYAKISNPPFSAPPRFWTPFWGLLGALLGPVVPTFARLSRLFGVFFALSGRSCPNLVPERPRGSLRGPIWDNFGSIFGRFPSDSRDLPFHICPPAESTVRPNSVLWPPTTVSHGGCPVLMLEGRRSPRSGLNNK